MPDVIHPIFVHFPAALLPLAALLALLSIRRETFRDAAALTVYLATLGALLAVALGLYEHEPYEHSAIGELVSGHERVGLVTLGIALVASVALFVGRRSGKDPVGKPWFAAILVVAALAVTAAGDTGGDLVYEHAAGVQGGRHVQGFHAEED